MQALRRWPKSSELRTARVGMEVPSYYLHPHHYLKLRDLLGPALVAEPNHLINDLKVAKSPRELDYHRRSARIAADAWSRALVRRPKRGDRAGIVGCRLPEDPVLGQFPAGKHDEPDDRRAQRICGWAGRPSGACSTATPGWSNSAALIDATPRRSAANGRSASQSARLLELRRIVCDASDAAAAEMKGRAPAIKAHEALKGVIARAGLDHHRQHTSGYGMAPGFPPSWGEPTNMFGGSRDVLQANMVMTVEPGLFSKDEGLGVRLIDNFIVTETGVERLSTTSRDIAVVE